MQFSIVATMFVANITMEPEISGMMSLGIPSPFEHSAALFPQPNYLMADGLDPGG